MGIFENIGEKVFSKRFRIVGVEDSEKIRKDFWNIVNNKEKVSVNILSENDVQVINIDGVDIVYIHVPRADYGIRPIYIGNNIMRGTFRRNHEGDYHCPEQIIRMMLRDTSDRSCDSLSLDGYSMDDIDLPTLKSFRIMFGMQNPEHIWNGLDDKEFLKQLGGYTVNRQTGAECLTMAGLLMFGKGLAVRERFDILRMDYIDKSNLIGEQRYSDRLTYDGRWENNLFNFVRIVVPKLTRNLPRPFAMEGVVRKDDTAQHKAVREAFTNMIIHADLMMNGTLRVEKYDDRIELTNPGLLKLPIEQIYRGGESKARNHRIQSMFRMIGYGENLGSGFPLILSAWNEKNWTEPKLVEQPELMQIKLVLNFEEKPKKETTPLDVQINVQKGGIKSHLANCQKSSDDTQHNGNEKNVQKGVGPESVKNQAYSNRNSRNKDENVIHGNVQKEPLDNQSNNYNKIRDLDKNDSENIATNDVQKELTNRQLDILLYILQKPEATLSEISQHIGVSVKTIQRDMDSAKSCGYYVSRKGSRKDGQWIFEKDEA